MKPKKPKRKAGPVERLLRAAKFLEVDLKTGWRFSALWHGQDYVLGEKSGLDAAISEARRRGL